MSTAKIKILVMDDEQDICEFLKKGLTRQGYTVDVAHNGREGLDRIAEEKYDIVISDIQMPEYDGLKALKEIKKISPNTEVIIVTGHDTRENAAQAMKLGAYDFVSKPINTEELYALIGKILEKSELRTLIALYESSKAIFSSLKLEELFPIMVSLLKNVVKADEVALLLFDKENQLYPAAASFSLHYSHTTDYIAFAERFYAQGKGSDAPLVVKHPGDDPLLKGIFKNHPLHSLLAHPITLKNNNLGILLLTRSRIEAPFGTGDTRNLAIFASQIAQSITNTKLYEKLEIKISELEAVHRQLEKTRKQLAFADRMSVVGHIATSIIHQFAAPLEAIAAGSEAVVSGKRACGDEIKTIHRNALQCREIIKNLEMFASCHKVEPVETDLNRLIEETLELLASEVAHENVQIETDLDEDLGRARVDVNRFKLVLINILANARQSFDGQFGNGRDKCISIRTKAFDSKAVIEINNNGTCIDANVIGRIFEPFFTTKGHNHNIGLGLSIANSIIQQHNGRIHVKSVPNEGTTFSISIPLAS